MEIRAFSEQDRNAVISLWEDCELTRPWNDPDKDIDRKLQCQPELFLVGVQDSNSVHDSSIVSTAMAGYDGHRAHVYYLAVHPDYQARGYGRQMMRHIESLLLEIGCPKINILVRSTNQSVLDFYTRLDYLKDESLSLGKRLIPDV